MLSSIEYMLPNNGSESQLAFARLKRLLRGSGDKVVLSSVSSLKPDTVFHLVPDISSAAIMLRTQDKTFKFPSSLLLDQARASAALPFAEVADRLTGSTVKVDHTGLVVPASVPSADWAKTIGFLAENAVVYDYPADVDGYDTKTARWLFTVPATSEEQFGEITIKQLRQPKFEMVWDAGIPVPVLQSDMETTLSRQQILALFPNDESFDIPGLEPFFRSVNATSPWPGIRNVRFDLRYVDPNPEELTPWNSADFFVQEGTRVRPNSLSVHLPNKNLG